MAVLIHLISTFLFLPLPSPALACLVWRAEPRNTVPVPPRQSPISVTSSLPGGQPFVPAAGRAERGRGGGDDGGAGELAAECSLDAGADIAPPRALSRRAVFLVGPLGLGGAGLHAGRCRARASALGGRRSVRTEALWVGVSRLGPGGRGVRAPIPCPDGPAGCRAPSGRT